MTWEVGNRAMSIMEKAKLKTKQFFRDMNQANRNYLW
jgi:hypothetical protein